MIEQPGTLPRQHGAARECGRSVRPALFQQRHDLLAQEVAVVRGVQVAGIVDPRQTMLAGVAFKEVKRGVQQRTPMPSAGKGAPVAHRRQPIHARSAQGTQQEGFRLVLQVMRGHQYLAGRHCLGERRIARVAGGRLHALAGVDGNPHMHDLQRYAPVIADALAVRGPVFGCRLQAVMDVDGAKDTLERRFRMEPVQQDSRIQTAAEADQQGRHDGGRGRQGEHATSLAGTPATQRSLFRMTMMAASQQTLTNRPRTQFWLTPFRCQRSRL